MRCGTGYDGNHELAIGPRGGGDNESWTIVKLERRLNDGEQIYCYANVRYAGAAGNGRSGDSDSLLIRLDAVDVELPSAATATERCQHNASYFQVNPIGAGESGRYVCRATGYAHAVADGAANLRLFKMSNAPANAFDGFRVAATAAAQALSLCDPKGGSGESGSNRRRVVVFAADPSTASLVRSDRRCTADIDTYATYIEDSGSGGGETPLTLTVLDSPSSGSCRVACVNGRCTASAATAVSALRRGDRFVVDRRARLTYSWSREPCDPHAYRGLLLDVRGGRSFVVLPPTRTTAIPRSAAGREATTAAESGLLSVTTSLAGKLLRGDDSAGASSPQAGGSVAQPTLTAFSTTAAAEAETTPSKSKASVTVASQSATERLPWSTASAHTADAAADREGGGDGEPKSTRVRAETATEAEAEATLTESTNVPMTVASERATERMTGLSVFVLITSAAAERRREGGGGPDNAPAMSLATVPPVEAVRTAATETPHKTSGGEGVTDKLPWSAALTLAASAALESGSSGSESTPNATAATVLQPLVDRISSSWRAADATADLAAVKSDQATIAHMPIQLLVSDRGSPEVSSSSDAPMTHAATTPQLRAALISTAEDRRLPSSVDVDMRYDTSDSQPSVRSTQLARLTAAVTVTSFIDGVRRSESGTTERRRANGDDQSTMTSESTDSLWSAADGEGGSGSSSGDGELQTPHLSISITSQTSAELVTASSEAPWRTIHEQTSDVLVSRPAVSGDTQGRDSLTEDQSYAIARTSNETDSSFDGTRMLTLVGATEAAAQTAHAERSLSISTQESRSTVWLLDKHTSTGAPAAAGDSSLGAMHSFSPSRITSTSVLSFASSPALQLAEASHDPALGVSRTTAAGVPHGETPPNTQVAFTTGIATFSAKSTASAAAIAAVTYWPLFAGDSAVTVDESKSAVVGHVTPAYVDPVSRSTIFAASSSGATASSFVTSELLYGIKHEVTVASEWHSTTETFKTTQPEVSRLDAAMATTTVSEGTSATFDAYNTRNDNDNDTEKHPISVSLVDDLFPATATAAISAGDERASAAATLSYPVGSRSDDDGSLPPASDGSVKLWARTLSMASAPADEVVTTKRATAEITPPSGNSLAGDGNGGAASSPLPTAAVRPVATTELGGDDLLIIVAAVCSALLLLALVVVVAVAAAAVDRRSGRMQAELGTPTSRATTAAAEASIPSAAAAAS